MKYFKETNLVIFEEDVKAFTEGVDGDDELVGRLLLAVDVEAVLQDNPLLRRGSFAPLLLRVVVLEPCRKRDVIVGVVDVVIDAEDVGFVELTTLLDIGPPSPGLSMVDPLPVGVDGAFRVFVKNKPLLPEGLQPSKLLSLD